MEMSPPLPESYDQDALVLMAQSPTTVCLYWEVSQRKIRMAERHFGCGWDTLPKRIRLYDITRLDFDGSLAHRVWELPAPAGNACYVHDLAPARTYAADLGVANIHNQFIPLVRSNALTTPWNSPEQAQALIEDGGEDGGFTPQYGPLVRPAAEAQPCVTLLPEGYARFSAYTVYPDSSGGRREGNRTVYHDSDWG